MMQLFRKVSLLEPAPKPQAEIKKLSDLKAGESGTIKSVNFTSEQQRLFELGFIEGTCVCVESSGESMQICIHGCLLGISSELAQDVSVVVD